tara:strand:- start:384 stop:494 length:111 start_codon:yes stop_codon:yes gene_type:complete
MGTESSLVPLSTRVRDDDGSYDDNMTEQLLLAIGEV